jgi:transcriptional regulator with XRE-family HTH domain
VTEGGLGQFLRTRRARVRPADVGLPGGGGRRRTPGLRREELATIAGVSVDYYARLEQGKETRPGPSVLQALARALSLDDEECAHLLALADHTAGRVPRRTALPSRTVRPGIRLLLQTVRPCPAYVLSRTNDVLAANPEALRLFAGLTDWPERQRNTIRFLFLHPGARELFVYWERAARSGLARLRAVAAADPDAPDLTALVGELSVKSPDFARLWQRYDVGLHSGGEKAFHHPQVGELTLSYETLAPLRTDGQRLVVYQAEPGTPDHDALLLLALTGDSAARDRGGAASG